MTNTIKSLFALAAMTATSAYAAAPALVQGVVDTCCAVGAACCNGGACC